MDFADEHGFYTVGFGRYAKLDDFENCSHRGGLLRFPRKKARPRFKDGGRVLCHWVLFHANAPVSMVA